MKVYKQAYAPRGCLPPPSPRRLGPVRLVRFAANVYDDGFSDGFLMVYVCWNYRIRKIMENLDTKNWRGEVMGVFWGCCGFMSLDTLTSEVARVSNLFNRNEKYQVSRLRAVSNLAGTKYGCFHVQEQSDLFNDDDDQVQLLWTGVFEDAVWLLCMRETKPSYSPMLTCLAYFGIVLGSIRNVLSSY